jgi:di/tricarboxylate transporter
MFGTLVIRLQLAVAASAFLIPSTSARAALFLPVLIAFLPALKPLGQRAIRIVALLIPTQILLTAGISITGAGAHLVAAQFMQTNAGYKVDALSWTLLALPVVAMTSLSASVVVLIAFRGLALWNLPIGAPQSDAQQPAPFTLPQKRVGLIALGVAAGWMLSPALDVPAWAIGLLGAVLAGTPRISSLDLDDLVRSVDWSLILFFAATVMIGETLGASGAAQWIARHTAALGAIDQIGTVGLLALVTMVSLLAHLWIPSRTARVIVLLPSTVLPLASGHHDLAVLTLVCVQASGFCQTFSASAKPMAVFCRQTLEGAAVISSHDLLRAAWPIGLAMAVAVMLSALFWWPRMVGISF